MGETFDSIAEWQQRTFPNATPLGTLAHMEKEIEEIEDCHRWGSDDEVKEELADVYILWVAACHRFGFGSAEMQHYIDAKMAKNRKRKWKAPDAQEVIEHVRGIED